MSKLHQIIENAFKAVESREYGKLEAVWTPSTEFRMLTQSFRGLGEFRQMCEGWHQAMPDFRHEVTAWIESGDVYCCELLVTGTHTGTMHTPKGELPATGNKVRLLSIDYVTFRDGRIHTWHAYPDMLGLLGQLGAF